ncbi:methyltransferase domain-containing protein [bacterium]|nr:methyltransferase domain-containing protein [bacterium]
MFKVHVSLSRADAERVANLLSDLDPSPASAVSTEETGRTIWSLDAFCATLAEAEGAAAIIELEAPGTSALIQEIEDKDWVAESLKGLPAVEAGPFVVAGAHELARLHGGRKRVWIEAGPAFGTGHHGTTKGCLEALARITRRRRLGRVLDVGAGSGVLSIAALKAGAQSAVGTDIDGESVRVARINGANNRVGRRLQISHAVGLRSPSVLNRTPYDLVLANILARPLIGLAGDLRRAVRPGGDIVLSGLLTHQEPQVRAAYRGQGLQLVDRTRLNGWSTLVFRRSPRAVEANRPKLRRRGPRERT